MKATQSSGRVRPSDTVPSSAQPSRAYLPAHAEIPPQDRFIKLKEVLARVGLSRTSLYELIKAGKFPKQIKLTNRSSAWSEQAVNAWMDAKKGGEA
jgi:prophage regulatory protein